jgi:hypothetical protein
MKDVFYTVLVVWIIWRVLNSVNVYRSKQSNAQQPPSRKEGETTVDYVPPTKKTINDDEGEYVDYEEIKKE